jgi:hypothetical protein
MWTILFDKRCPLRGNSGMLESRLFLAQSTCEEKMRLAPTASSVSRAGQSQICASRQAR